MALPEVTVALSAYNVAEFVGASLDCILAQTFRDFELLCIDDASTDGTWEVLQEYAAKDGRIKLLHQDCNQGLSVSRNRAIDEARGEYLLMLDGDDLFDPDMVEKAYGLAKVAGADVVMWDYVVFYDDRQIPALKAQESSLAAIQPSDKVALLRRPAFMWTKLFRTAWLREQSVRFPDGLTKQDIPVWWKVVTSTDWIALLPERLSYYRQQPGSTSNRKDRSVFSLAYVMDIVERQLKEDGIYEAYRNEFLRSRLSLLHGMYDAVSPAWKDEAMALVQERLGEQEQAFIKGPDNELTSRVRDFYGMLAGDRWATMRYRGLQAARSVYRKIRRTK